MSIRVQIPVYTDRWMMGDRYGEIIEVRKNTKGVSRRESGTGHIPLGTNIAVVKLDKSGRRIRVILDDCQWVSA